MRRSAALLVVLLFLGSLAVAGCPQRGPQQTTTEPPTTEPSASPTTATTEGEIVVKLYFIEEFDATMFLVPENRTIPRTQAVAKAALEELIKGPRQPGRISVIPRSTEVRSVNIADGLATVDFSREVLRANVGAEGEELGIAQIVNTLTEFSNIRRVRFLVEGRDSGLIDGREIQDWWGHIGLADQPFSRREDLIQGGRVRNEVIRVESPRAFSTIKSPLVAKGQARVFEATFQVRVLDKNDTVLADQQIMADDFDFGDFNREIPLKKPAEPGRGTVLYYYYSPKDGSEIPMARITVFLE